VHGVAESLACEILVSHGGAQTAGSFASSYNNRTPIHRLVFGQCEIGRLTSIAAATAERDEVGHALESPVGTFVSRAASGRPNISDWCIL